MCEAVEEENRSNRKGRRETKRKRRTGTTKQGGKRKGEQEEKKKRGERRKGKAKNPERVSLLESSPSKQTMVVDVYRHCCELLIVVKVWCFHTDFYFIF